MSYQPSPPIIAGTNLPSQTSPALPVAQVPSKSWRCGFESAIAANAVDTAWMSLIVNGAGQGISQAGGSLLLTSGTTANSETIARSIKAFVGDLVLRASVTVSQRIINNNFFIELVDVIGDGLALTVNSATSITVVIPGTTFTAQNVGQSMYIGNITGVANAIPGRYTIASVSGTSVTFTVAGWPASGSGTVSLFGWNYHHMLYTGTAATATNYDAQRAGYASGDTITIVNSTTTGHVITLSSNEGKSALFDELSASSTALELTQRASRVRNVPVDETTLYLQIRSQNGTVAPVSTTTFTIGFVEINNIVFTNTSIGNIAPQSANAGLPVSVVNIPAVTVSSGAIVVSSGAIAATMLASPTSSPTKAEDSPAASLDVGDFILGVRRDTLTISASANGDYNEIAVDKYGSPVTKDQQKHKRTYSVSFSVVPAATATDIAQIIGSATTSVQITKIVITGIQTTGGMANVVIQKRSTANTGGTSSAGSLVPHESSDAAATAVCSIYTANPTTGTPVGNLRNILVPLPASTGSINPVEINFAENGKPVILAGVAQALAINLVGATITGGLIYVSIEFTEE